MAPRLVGVADLPQAQPVGGASCPPAARSRGPEDRQHSPRGAAAGPTSTRVPTIERTIWWQNAVACDLEAQHAVTEIVPRASSTRRTSVTGSRLGPGFGRRQNDAKSCSPMQGIAAEAHGRAGRAGLGTHQAGRRPGTGRAPAGSAPCSGSARQRAEKRASKSRARRCGLAHHDASGRQSALHAPAGPLGQVEAGRRRRRSCTTWPQACTPASVRPAHGQRDRWPQDPLERVR